MWSLNTTTTIRHTLRVFWGRSSCGIILGHPGVILNHPEIILESSKATRGGINSHDLSIILLFAKSTCEYVFYDLKLDLLLFNFKIRQNNSTAS